MKFQFIKDFERIEEGMKVKIKKRDMENWLSGTIAKVKYEENIRFIDSKPVRTRKVRTFTVLCDCGQTINISCNEKIIESIQLFK